MWFPFHGMSKAVTSLCLSVALLCLLAASSLLAAGEQVSHERAFQFLVQSTFGPTQTEIIRVQQLGLEGWLDAQLSSPSAYDHQDDEHLSHLQLTIRFAQTLQPKLYPSDAPIFNNHMSRFVLSHQMSAWWHNGIGLSSAYPLIGKDQLRQRVAYALSQLLVVSHTEPPLHGRSEALAHYYDLLARNAFGNYRQLLSEVSRSPAMGVYLSHRNSRKANPRTGRHPDENYARELLQLFTLGVYQKNLNGTPNFDGDATTLHDSGSILIPSYEQSDVEELAKVLTGWHISGEPFDQVRHKVADYTTWMENTPRFHEDERAENGDGVVHILQQPINLRQGNARDHLEQALDIIFAQPNLAPHVSQHLIMNMVTSNPSTEYVSRVARVFNDNGQGVKGDLASVIKAILLDPEAANPQPKYKEPFVAYVQLLRLLGVDSRGKGGIYKFPKVNEKIGQAPLRSDTVFNFYDPEYVPKGGHFSEDNLVSPEIEIMTESQIIEFNNQIQRLVYQCDLGRLSRLETLKKTAPACDSLGMQYDLAGLLEPMPETLIDNDFSQLNELTEKQQVSQILTVLAKRMIGQELPARFKNRLVESIWQNRNIRHKGYPIDLVVKYAIYSIAVSPIYKVQV